MKQIFKLLPVVLIILNISAYGQVEQKKFHEISEYANDFFGKKFNDYQNPFQENDLMIRSEKSISDNENIVQINNKYSSFRNFENSFKVSNKKSIDTLIVGAYGNDSLVITGTYFHNGPILVINDGKLRFRNANATIIGDIYVWGNNAKLLIDSSYIYCPQQYFYQRTILAAGKGKVIINNSTLDYSGLSHNLALADSSSAIYTNITNIGFTTCGLWGAPQIKINKTNQAGEFIASGNARLEFKKAKTLLIWHQFPSGANVDIAFPAGASVNTYSFNNSTPGVSGIGYSVKADTCTDVMWGLMPTNGSTTKISNSVLRTIGLWFEGNDTINVNGLVNNTNYTDFTANLNDRNLRLINTSITTWSLYPMQRSHVYISGCIVGEIGNQGRSRLDASSIVVDGSGGYVFATDTTVMLLGHSSATCAVRSDKNGILIFAYSSQMNGVANSLGQSVMVIIQSNLQEEPIPLDRSCMWNENISSPSSGFIDSVVNISGSAWIDKTFASPLMDFSYYDIYYQKENDSVWTPIVKKVHVEKRSETLATWNTHGLTAGNYVLKIVLCDNSSPDTNKFDAMKAISLLPKILSVDEFLKDSDVNVFPNPATKFINVSLPVSCNLMLLNAYSQMIYSEKNCKVNTKIDVSDLSKGVYFLKIGERITKKIIIL